MVVVVAIVGVSFRLVDGDVVIADRSSWLFVTEKGMWLMGFRVEAGEGFGRWDRFFGATFLLYECFN